MTVRPLLRCDQSRISLLWNLACLIALLRAHQTRGWTRNLATKHSNGRHTRCCCWHATRNDGNILDPPPKLSVIIPAYNEALRIEATLREYLDYFQNSTRWRDCTSIVVVDDGSVDGTFDVVEQVAVDALTTGSTIPLECLVLLENRGKGAALTHGIETVCQRLPTNTTNKRCNNNNLIILTADADGSAEIADLEVLYTALEHIVSSQCDANVAEGKQTSSEQQHAILINGYRTYESESLSPFRLFFRWGFRTVVRMVIDDLGVQDSQCGFKLMTTAAAKALYSNLNLQGWSHDVEVLYRAKRLGVTVVEEPIRWEDKEGSKLVASPGGVIAVCWKMFWEVVKLRVAYGSGDWRASNSTLEGVAESYERS